MKKYNFLAFDIGATSGRAVLGTLVGDKFEMQELHRFPNAIMELHGKYYWDIYRLYDALKESLTICARRNLLPDSIGIDTWGVDFGYLAEDGTLLGLPRAYRDPYTDGAPEEYFQRVPRSEVYRLTGIQIMNFNSVFQLFRAKKEGFGPLEAAEEILFMPDLLSYLLTGKKGCEYTDASTSGLLNPVTKEFEASLLEAAGVAPSIMRPVVMPGTFVGELTDALARETGIGKVPVIAVAGHDTASAVAAVPAADREFAYLSSGTWSLITGMWLLEQCRKEWEKAGRDYSYPAIVKMAERATPFRRFVNPDDPRFANPPSMTEAIKAYCRETGQPEPVEDDEFIRCIFESLAFRYKEVLALLSEIAPFPIRKLHVIGGGSMNNLLNQFTANVINMPVVAGPSEATAIGNCMVQARAAGLVADRWEMRRLINSFLSPAVFLPEGSGEWEEAFRKYKSVTSKK